MLCTGEPVAEIDGAGGEGGSEGRRDGEDEEEGAADFSSLHG